MDCATCESKKADPVPFPVFESVKATMERGARRLWIVILVLLLLLAGSNIGWLVYESQFTDEVWTIEAEADEGSRAIANGNGEVTIYGGESESDGPEADA